MSTPVRVLVVDDSIVVRRLITDVLDSDPMIEVAGTAANGRIALDKLDTIRPDLITLDIEMPEMNGIETLREIRKRDRRVPIVMFSTLTERGASATLDALAAGANDFVTKPANVGSVTEGMQAVRHDLVPKVLHLCGRVVPTAPTNIAGARIGSLPGGSPAFRPSTTSPAPGRPAFTRPRSSGPSTGVVIGVSTGGPNALSDIWPTLTRIDVPILIVQHMPPVFTGMLAKRLDGIGTIPVVEATDGDEVLPGHAYLAPGDQHMLIETGALHPRIRVVDDPPENSCRPAVDPLFRSAATVFGGGTLAIVLTGMGTDGVAGAQVVREAGGTVLAQDEVSSVVWGMPGAVVKAGLADAVIPLREVASEIAIRTNRTRREAPRRPAGVT